MEGEVQKVVEEAVEAAKADIGAEVAQEAESVKAALPEPGETVSAADLAALRARLDKLEGTVTEWTPTVSSLTQRAATEPKAAPSTSPADEDRPEIPSPTSSSAPSPAPVVVKLNPPKPVEAAKKPARMARTFRRRASA
jgi:hypothetical protein